MSSCVRPGYSASSSVSAIPDANRSRISDTQMRVPLMQGLPPHIRGSIEMRSSCGFIVHPDSMTLLYRKSRGCGLISDWLIDPERSYAQLQPEGRAEIRSEKACRAGARPGRRG